MRTRVILFGSTVALVTLVAQAQPAPTSPSSASTAATASATAPAVGATTSGNPKTTAGASPSAPHGAEPATPPDLTRGAAMGAYHTAYEQRRLGSQVDVPREELELRLREAEEYLTTGRTDAAIARLTGIVDHPKFAPYETTELGRSARYLLGDALANAGIYESARAHLRKVVSSPASWQDAAIYGRRAARRLVEIAIQESASAGQASLLKGQEDLKDIPATAPEDTKSELTYLAGRTKEAQKDWSGALAAYGQVSAKSRHWSQATYLAALIHVEQGRYKEGEDLFCKIADPKRQTRTTPVLADERFFAIRDLARLALGRIAHENSRFDDARYYYYLVPKDSDRLAEALYEGATSRYEKKDYDGARELLDELAAMNSHHRYEDEVYILEAYLDLAQCKFPDADKKLRAFIARYEPAREAARKIQASDRGMRALLSAARGGADAAANDAASVSVSIEGLRTVATLLRVDPAWSVISRRLAVMDHEAAGLRRARGELRDLEEYVKAGGGLRPALVDTGDGDDRSELVKASLDGLRRSIDELEGAGAKDTSAFRSELKRLEAELARASSAGRAAPGGRASGTDLPDLLRNDAVRAEELLAELDTARAELQKAESALARDALSRLDLRVSRLLRRARLGRIESVLGKKRALEVEIEAISAGYLPQDAVDSFNPVRYLTDKEEYWPFQGDDWADEYVGGEKSK